MEQPYKILMMANGQKLTRIKICECVISIKKKAPSALNHNIMIEDRLKNMKAKQDVFFFFILFSNYSN